MAATLLSLHHLAPFFGILGNIVSFLVFLSPMPTFHSICKARFTQGFDPLPYSVALFSCMLTGYYGLVKRNVLLITINSVGILVESVYLTIYMLFAPRKERLNTGKLLLSFNVGLLGLIILLTTLTIHGATRETAVGWICAICSVCVFASPLSVIRTVITTKSVEFLPFWLSLTLTASAVIWFLFGYLINDLFVAMPNVLGVLFGIVQMSLYCAYKKNPVKKETLVDANGTKTAELSTVDVVKMEAGEITTVEEEPAKSVQIIEKCNVQNDTNKAALPKLPNVECVV